METTVLDYSQSLASSVAAVGNECDLLSSSKFYWIIAASIGISITGILLCLKAFRNTIASYTDNEAIDPDNILTNELQELQQRMKSIYHKLPPRYWLHRWLMRRLHAETGIIRIGIMEHDADLAVTTGTFSNARDLLNHLNSL